MPNRPTLAPNLATTLILAIALACVMAALPPAPVIADDFSYSWQDGDSEAGVRLYTSEVQRHGYDVVKGTAAVPFPARHLLDILQAFERYTQWYYRAADVRVLSAPEKVPEVSVAADGAFTDIPSGGPWLLYFRQRTPPLADRWTILRCGFRRGPGGSLRVDFHTQRARGFRAPKDAVHMQLHGYWQLKPLGTARTLVTFMIDADPDTSVPAFLVDPELRAIVVETLGGLQRQALALRRKPAAAVADSSPR